ncbi:MAG: hypothetical protein P8M72_07505 [Gammaproteobacteria bacterium]|nr:hypothetical protein [Gammaproteobacteria bacterium]
MEILRSFKPLQMVMAGVLLGSYAQGVWAQVGDEVDGLIDEYCSKCHNFEDYSGGIDLEGIGVHNIAEYPDIGEMVIKRLRAGMLRSVTRGAAQDNYKFSSLVMGVINSPAFTMNIKPRAFKQLV